MLSIALMQWLGTIGLAIASNVAVIAQAWFLQTRLSRKMPELGLASLLPNLAKIAVATTLMGAAVFAGTVLVGHLSLSQTWRDAFVVGGLIPLGAALYGGLLWVLKIEGRDELSALIGKFGSKGDAR